MKKQFTFLTLTNIDEYIAERIDSYACEIQEIQDYIENWKHIKNNIDLQMNFRRNIYNEFEKKRIIRMGRLRPNEIKFNSDLEINVRNNLKKIDEYFGLTKELIFDNTKGKLNFPDWYFEP